MPHPIKEVSVEKRANTFAFNVFINMQLVQPVLSTGSKKAVQCVTMSMIIHVKDSYLSIIII